MSQYMTLKQRRRYRELREQFDQLQPKLPPIDYEPGSDPERDDDYRAAVEAFNQVIEEMHAIEEASQGN
jgi:hypothetical protein